MEKAGESCYKSSMKKAGQVPHAVFILAHVHSMFQNTVFLKKIREGFYISEIIFKSWRLVL